MVACWTDRALWPEAQRTLSESRHRFKKRKKNVYIIVGKEVEPVDAEHCGSAGFSSKRSRQSCFSTMQAGKAAAEWDCGAVSVWSRLPQRHGWQQLHSADPHPCQQSRPGHRQGRRDHQTTAGLLIICHRNTPLTACQHDQFWPILNFLSKGCSRCKLISENFVEMQQLNTQNNAEIINCAESHWNRQKWFLCIKVYLFYEIFTWSISRKVLFWCIYRHQNSTEFSVVIYLMYDLERQSSHSLSLSWENWVISYLADLMCLMVPNYQHRPWMVFIEIIFQTTIMSSFDKKCEMQSRPKALIFLA